MNRSVLIALVCAGLTCAQSPEYQPLANTKHLMAGATKPAMDALAAVNKAGGPKDDAEWQQAEQHAALIGEMAQLLLMGKRPLDQDVWVKNSTKMQGSAAALLKASHEKDLQGWKTSLGQLGSSCRGCHTVHKKKTN